MRFSVIVPVYNVEKYIRKCIDSILAQTYRDYELILVDDGSKDNSGKICDSYINMNNSINIKCIHKKNGGLSDARNTGIANATGDFLVFVDSDDWIDRNALYNINAVINNRNIDVVVTRFVEVFDNKFIYKDSEIDSLKNVTNEEIIKFIFEKSENTWPAQKYIVNKNYIIKKRLRFKFGILHEDLDWTARLFLEGPSCAVMDVEWYYHRMGRSGSITSEVKEKNITDVIEMGAFFYANLHTSEEASKLMILKRIIESVYGSIKKYKYCSKKDKLVVEKKVRDNVAIFSIHSKLKYKIFYIFLRLFGSKVSLSILSFFNV